MSIFDPNTFGETVYKGEVDYDYHVCPIGDYLAQITDVKYREVTFKKVEGTGVGVDISWEVKDDAVKTAMNMDQPTVRQSFLLDLVEKELAKGNAVIDWGVNRNMKLKRIRQACGLANGGAFNLGMLKFKTAYVHVDHRPDENDPEVVYSEVTRVTSLEKARAASGS
jgi:hypothetical protein